MSVEHEVCELCKKEGGCNDWQKLEKARTSGIDLRNLLLLITPCPQIRQLSQQHIQNKIGGQKVFGVDTITFRRKG